MIVFDLSFKRNRPLRTAVRRDVSSRSTKSVSEKSVDVQAVIERSESENVTQRAEFGSSEFSQSQRKTAVVVLCPT